MLGPFATASRRTPHCHLPGVATVASHAACASMSTTTTTTTTTRDRGDRYGLMDWAQLTCEPFLSLALMFSVHSESSPGFDYITQVLVFNLKRQLHQLRSISTRSLPVASAAFVIVISSVSSHRTLSHLNRLRRKATQFAVAAVRPIRTKWVALSRLISRSHGELDRFTVHWVRMK